MTVGQDLGIPQVHVPQSLKSKQLEDTGRQKQCKWSILTDPH